MISGYLITQSFMRRRDGRAFLVSRVHRIVPALAVVLIVTALGPMNSWYWNTPVALPITVSIAALSWHVVEAPALALKAKF